MDIRLNFINELPISDIRILAYATMGRKPDDVPDLPEHKLYDYGIKVITEEHSILHEAILQVDIYDCPSTVVSHLVRHTNNLPRHYVQSFRPDWTKKPRPTDPTAPRLYFSTWPINALLAMARQRLCWRSAVDTYNTVRGIKDALRNQSFNNNQQSIFARTVAWGMVPNCVYRNGCPESKSCGFWHRVSSCFEICNSIQDRYDLFNSDSLLTREGGGGA